MFALRLAQDMGMPLHELEQRMTSAEFSLHVALAVHDARDRVASRNSEPPTPDELEWFGGAS